MTTERQEPPIRDRILIQSVFMSVNNNNKPCLGRWVDVLLEINPNVEFFSTGGTYTALETALGSRAGGHLFYTERFLELPEIGQGGQVKPPSQKLSLDTRQIHAGIVANPNNPNHQAYLQHQLGNAVSFDAVMVSLKPLDELVKDEETPIEAVRTSFDIGGSALVRAAAQNFLSCLVIVNPTDAELLVKVRENGGTTFTDRFECAQQALQYLAGRERALDYWLSKVTLSRAQAEYATRLRRT